MSVKVTTSRVFTIECDEECAKKLRALIGNIGYCPDDLIELYEALRGHVDAEFWDYFRIQNESLEAWPR